MKPAVMMICLALGFLSVGCEPATPRHDSETGGRHEHEAPHGGVAVSLGEEQYHLELVLDPNSGKMTAYVLDGELDKFVRITSPTFSILSFPGGQNETLTFRAVASRATGETVGDTSQFETQADWLKATKVFDATLQLLTVRGTTFTNVAFNFPKGNER